VMIKHRFRCSTPGCTNWANLEMDHVHPYGKDGPTDYSNCEPKCTPCHKIKTEQGTKWLTLSVKKAPRNTAINQIELSTDTDWRQDNLHLLKQNYRNAPFYGELILEIERLYARPFHMLRDFNMASIEMLVDMLDVRIPWVWSSSLDPVGTKNELMVNLLEKVSATHYLSGMGARDYFQPEHFAQAGIEVIWQDFIHPVYAQQFGEFVPYLSALDVLFNHGLTASREILRRCG